MNAEPVKKYVVALLEDEAWVFAPSKWADYLEAYAMSALDKPVPDIEKYAFAVRAETVSDPEGLEPCMIDGMRAQLRERRVDRK